MTQFTKRSAQPLTPGGIDLACARMRKLIQEIEVDAPSPPNSDDARTLSRNIEALRHAAIRLSRRYCEREAYRQADGTIAEMIP